MSTTADTPPASPSDANRPTAHGLYDPAQERDACGIGFVVNMRGKKSHQIVEQALTILSRLLHRGACGCEDNTGDGAGILMQIPDKFYRRECAVLRVDLPDPGHYGTGLVFLPRDPEQRSLCQNLFAEVIEEEGQRLIGWRDVPVDDSHLGPSALACRPYVMQVFIERNSDIADEQAFERRLYIIRKVVERRVGMTALEQGELFYVPSLSCRTIIYKGMLIGTQIGQLFPDVMDPDTESALALVHQRFSTNTFPSWPLAQPFRFISHNGEINTLRGNVSWMRAREALCRSSVFADELEKLFPVVLEGASDSASFDNVMEFLHMAGRPLPLAILMMIPEAWSGHESMTPERRAFYEYHGCMMEPWDGPASIAFTDGKVIGAVLDRNGLRPSRYYVTKDDVVVMASEVGVLELPPEDIAIKERLHPGRIFMVDMEQGRIIDDTELKAEFEQANPYGEWLQDNLIRLSELPNGTPAAPQPTESLLTRQQAFGYTHEDLRLLMAPMAKNGIEPTGSMGTDAALAVLSDRPRLLYDYFKQLFAQVTNPPLDGIREELVTQVATPIGPEGNLLSPGPEHCRQLHLDSPVITDTDVAKLRAYGADDYKTATLATLYPVRAGKAGLEQAMEDLFANADAAIKDGARYLVLSDRGVDRDHAPIPALLATAGVHHHLVRKGTRVKVGIIIETGEAREVHHFCMLLGYGAGAINPYLAFESIDNLIDSDIIPAGEIKNAGDDAKSAAKKNFVKAVNKGLVKVMSKMGISSVQSYRGAQIFEALGLDKAFVDRYFTYTASRIGGVGMLVIERECSLRHSHAYPDRAAGPVELDWGGEYQWRRDGEYHLFNPETVFKLQHATRSKRFDIFRDYTKRVDDQSRHRATLRGLFDLKPVGPAVPIDEVEPASEIFKRFSTGAMSLGSISKEAHETLAVAMNRLGGKSNTGEGGEDRARFTPDTNGDLRRSAIKQVASGRFGVTSEYLANADDIQIKMAQGAKPGEGGQLPGHKVYPWIAEVRHSTPAVGLISPPPHHDIYSIEDLAQLIHDLKNANPEARIHVKLVAEVGVGTVAAGVAKAFSDVVLISGYDGGTGASPITSLKHAGLPWELGLAETQQTLVKNRLRDRIVVQTDGQLKTGRDVVVAALLGAEEYGFSTAPLVVMGCIMMRVCHLNTCPVGVATQNPELTKKFAGEPEFVETFFEFIAEEIRELMAELGFRTMDEMIGRTDCIDAEPALDHWKARGLDFSQLLIKPDEMRANAIGNVDADSVAIRCITTQDHGLDKSLDRTTILPLCEPALNDKKPVSAILPIKNINRTVGTILGYEVSKRFGDEGLPEDTISIHFNGSAGQSFGAFLPPGITFTVEGDANDYVGKGLSGGRIIVYPPRHSSFVAEKNIIVGNVVLYGATSGEAYFRGIAGERFCVRNSGAKAVVEGVGDHCCEYMTGGRVAILGPTGRNFGAGMSGGIAYVYDPEDTFQARCNMEMVLLEKVTAEVDSRELSDMIEKHLHFTQSEVARRLLDNWDYELTRFVKVTPEDYKRVLDAMERARRDGVPELEYVMEAAHG